MADNKILPEACKHVVAGDLKHLHTLEVELVLTTAKGADDDYRYGTAPDRMRVCAFCAGVLMATLLRDEVAGRAPK